MPSYTVVYEGKKQEAAYKRLFKRFNVKAKRYTCGMELDPLPCLRIEHGQMDIDKLLELADAAQELRSSSKAFKDA